MNHLLLAILEEILRILNQINKKLDILTRQKEEI